MGISAKQAAESIGITKHGLLKAIREGRVSAKKNEKGQWEIEPSELYRVYKPVNQDNSNQVTKSQRSNTPKVNSPLNLEINELRLKLQFAEEKIALLENQIEKTEAREETLIALATSQTKQLEDMREKSSHKPTETRKSFWDRLLGKNS